jgi:transketolase
MMTQRALEAVRELAKDGVAVRLLHVPTVKPLDEEAVVRAARETGLIVTVENHSRLGGLGGAVAECVTRHAPCRVVRLGFPDVFGESGDNEDVFRKMGLTSAQIAATVRSTLAEPRP